MPPTSSSDYENYLENLLESLSTVPSEVRRNLDHLRELDYQCTNDLTLLHQLQKQFILLSERSMMKLHIHPITNLRSNNNPNSDENDIIIQTTNHDIVDNTSGSDKNRNNNDNDIVMTEQQPQPNESNNDDNVAQQQHHDNNNPTPGKRQASLDEPNSNNNEICISKKRKIVLGVRVLSDDDDNDDNEDNEENTKIKDKSDKKPNENQADNNNNNNNNNTSKEGNDKDTSTDEYILPTTEEITEYIYLDNQDKTYTSNDGTTTTRTFKELYQQIKHLQKECLQKSAEKVRVAQQTIEIIIVHIQRIENDLIPIEKIVQATTGEVVDSASGTVVMKRPAQPNDLAACQVTPGSEWILAKVISYDTQLSMYTLSDEDVESDKIFTLPETQVIILPGNPSRGSDYRLAKGDVVFAIYPDTTSFYKATVVQAPRKHGNTTAALNQMVMVNFVDDSDEYGITHDKAVPLKYIMPPPER